MTLPKKLDVQYYHSDMICWVYTFGYNKPKNYKKPYPELEFFFNLNVENNDYEKK